MKSSNLFGAVNTSKVTDESNRKDKLGCSSVKVGEKSAVELMQDMLRGVNSKEINNPYYLNGSQ
jgi:hypothetical protein